MYFPKNPKPEQKELIERAGLDPWEYLVETDTETVLTVSQRIDGRNVIRIDKATGKWLNDPSMMEKK